MQLVEKQAEVKHANEQHKLQDIYFLKIHIIMLVAQKDFTKYSNSLAKISQQAKQEKFTIKCL